MQADGHSQTAASVRECECGSGYDAEFWTGDGWMCGQCYDEREAEREDTVLGYCPHGVNLDREFCPKGCRV